VSRSDLRLEGNTLLRATCVPLLPIPLQKIVACRDHHYLQGTKRRPGLCTDRASPSQSSDA
jgi:hypothetical protein